MLSHARKLVQGAAISTLAVSLAVGGAAVANAEPSALAQATAAAASEQTVASAQAELDRLHEELGDIEENFAQARFAQEAAQKRADALKADIAAQQAKVDKLRAQAAVIARASFQNGGVDTTTQLFVSGDPDSFLQQISTVAKVDENMNTVLQQFQGEQANLADLQRAADAELANATEAAKKAADAEVKGRQNIEDAKALVARLSSEQQARLQQAEDARARAAETAGAEQASQLVSAAKSKPAAEPLGTGSASSSAAAQAVSYARSKIGSAYVWGAEGPNAFDCSGLVVAAYRSAGVSLPHSSLTLSRMGASVSRSDLRPGDLVFWYSPVHHVAIYEGNGNMIHAQNPRVGVLRTPMSQWFGYGITYSGAKRVG